MSRMFILVSGVFILAGVHLLHAVLSDFKDTVSISVAVFPKHRAIKCHCKLAGRVCILKHNCLPPTTPVPSVTLSCCLDVMYKARGFSYSPDLEHTTASRV